jgi:hypothetical protein
VTFVFSTMPPAISNSKAGKLRALAVTTPKRVAAAPEVPTMIEAGLPNFEIVLYSGILGPRGMDRALVRRLNAEFAKAVESPEMKQVWQNLGADPIVDDARGVRGRDGARDREARARGQGVGGKARVRLLPQHSRYDFRPLPERKPYAWPLGRRLAFTVTTNIEWFAFGAGLGHDPAKTGEPQTHRNYAWRDYGNRIGVWRLFELLDELGLPAGHCTNSLVYDYAPQITDAIRRRGDELIAHGRTNAENLLGLWQPDEERILREVTETIRAARAERPAGWFGAGAYETAHTPDLLQGARLPLPHGLADGRPAGVAAHPRRPAPLGALTRSRPTTRRPSSIANGARLAFADAVVDQFDEMLAQSERACARHERLAPPVCFRTAVPPAAACAAR